MNRYLLAMVVTLVMAGTFDVAARSGDVQSQLAAYKVIMVDGKEAFKKASVAQPGDLIEYRVTHKNGTGAKLGSFTVNGPIPDGTNFVPGSQTKSEALVFEAKIEDGAWAVPPLKKTVRGDDGQDRQVVVDPRDYDAVRWIHRAPLAPDGTSLVTYRVRVAR